MDSSNDVKILLLSLLIEQTEPITANELANQTGKSSKTIRTYLKSISEVLEKDGVKIVRKPNVGIYLDIEESERVLLKNKYIKQVNRCEVYDSKYRIKYILEILLINKFKYTMQMFADDLYCSKSTIANDFESVDDWLQTYKLQLTRMRTKGFWIVGSEINIRNAIISYLKEFSKDDYRIQSIEKNHIDLEDIDYRLSIGNYNKLKEFFPELNLIKIQNIISKAEENLGNSFTDQAFINLMTHIAIAIKRVKEKKQIIMSEEFNDKYKNSKVYPVAKILVNDISDNFNVTLPEDEIAYICLHLLGSKINENITDENCSVILENQDEHYVNLAKEIVHIIGNVLGVDIDQDEILIASLALHIRPVIIRLENGLTLDNPMLDTIKNEYPSVFCASWVAGTIFEKECGVLINKDEVAYIAMHIAAAMERYKQGIKAIVVCSSGIGTAQWIKSKLIKRFYNMKVIDVLSVDNLTQDNINSCDLIISTVPYQFNSEKVVYVNTILDNQDIQSIMNKINELEGKIMIYGDKNIQEDESDLELITEDYCFIENELTEYDEIIMKYGQRLIEGGYAKQGFIESALDREKISSTNLGKGISIPHSAPNYVNKSKILVLKLGKPILYKDELIEIMFIMCLKLEGYDITTNIFGEFYAMLDDHEYMKKLKTARCPIEINKILRRFNYDRTSNRKFD